MIERFFLQALAVLQGGKLNIREGISEGLEHELLCLICRKRSFVLSCFLSDDTLAIFEPITKNSGIVGGKYLERRQVTHTDSPPPSQGQHESLPSCESYSASVLRHSLGLTLSCTDS